MDEKYLINKIEEAKKMMKECKEDKGQGPPEVV